ncbi:MAG: hypothetical protein IS632_06720 [Thaumarchaeota archaeon]|nr:hypothetical protein [Nitrososphaerota archaeon]
MSGPGTLRTGMVALDEFLGGSLPRGMILDVYGPGGSGKSQLLMQAATEAAAAGCRVAFVDTTGAFRPERILQMHPAPGILHDIDVLRATSVAEQVAAPAMAGDVDLLLLDNITDLFSYEYGEEKAPARGRELAVHMREIARWAITYDAGVVVANTVRRAGDNNVESMRHVVDLYTHAKLRLSGGPEYMAECSRWDATARFGYTIHAGGLRSGPVAGDAP